MTHGRPAKSASLWDSRYGLIVAEMVRMGTRVSIAENQRPLSWFGSELVTVDESGVELGREVVPDGPALVLRVVHFVDVDDGRRITTEALGGMSLSVAGDCTLDELREALREFIFEDELREVDDELADEPRWEDMSSVLREHDIVADDQALIALPFVVELDDDVAVELDRT